MARIRTIKPDFFRHERLFDAEKASCLPLRVAFAGLWTIADREGRFQWRPRVLKMDVLPYDDVDFTAVMDALASYGFILKYKNAGEEYGYVPSWKEHQIVNNREVESKNPEPPTRQARVRHASGTRHGNDQVEGKGTGREGKGTGTVKSSSEPLTRSEPEPLPSFVLLPTNIAGREVPVSFREVEDFTSTYPGVDVEQELREMRAWLIANQTKRKTSKGMPGFVHRWLGREQDKTHDRGRTGTQQQGRGVRPAVEHALAAIERAASEDDAGRAQQPIADAPRRLQAPARTTSDSGGDHQTPSLPRRDLPLPSPHDRGTEPEVSNILRRSGSFTGMEDPQCLRALPQEFGESFLSDPGPIARVV